LLRLLHYSAFFFCSKHNQRLKVGSCLRPNLPCTRSLVTCGSTYRLPALKLGLGGFYELSSELPPSSLSSIPLQLSLASRKKRRNAWLAGKLGRQVQLMQMQPVTRKRGGRYDHDHDATCIPRVAAWFASSNNELYMRDGQ
jgi:hypothetical protein